MENELSNRAVAHCDNILKTILNSLKIYGVVIENLFFVIHNITFKWKEASWQEFIEIKNQQDKQDWTDYKPA